MTRLLSYNCKLATLLASLPGTEALWTAANVAAHEAVLLLQESIAAQAVVMGASSEALSSHHLQELCSQLLTHLEQEEYVYSYIQAHT